ncbi:MAG TPA: M20/M25/M40 family metallo-hydrolase [Chitinophagaceae bacterium]|jgi:hypothetical protein|nr:M20/M25/M40 family metallo-hydrolase [Chitinophagaceae bacterium]
MMRTLLLLTALLFLGTADAQKPKKEDRQLVSNLQKHVQYLASDALEGRRTGTKGEQLAMAYISEAFGAAGLQPRGTNGFYQPFTIQEGRQVNETTHLVIDGHSLQLHKEFFPLSFSQNASLEALPSPGLEEMGMPWFIDLKEQLEANKNNPHFDAAENIRKTVKEHQKKGASALFLYNSSDLNDGISFRATDRSEPATIPVVYLTKEAAKKYLKEGADILDIKLKTDIGPKSRTGNNVIGFIDNKAATTVVIGAHFDHLGWGEDGNSLHRTERAVHNGADDNASGTAALIELARLLKASKLTANNYLFIAFSGEELGLWGSKYFTEHPTVDLSTANYMINMDMIGRLNNANPSLTVGGFGTSPAWGAAYAVSGKKGLYTSPLRFRFDSTGTGPSDHTSFYQKNIPVLFYFTGLHTDYHRPSDDPEKVNYEGQMHVVKHIYSLIESQNRNGRLAFTRTRDRQMGASAAFSVTLGIMPDYTFTGAGVKVDGISENRPAQKAGMKAGDVVVQLGEHAITSMESYMQALSKFKKGDKTTVVYQRGSEKQSAAIEF